MVVRSSRCFSAADTGEWVAAVRTAATCSLIAQRPTRMSAVGHRDAKSASMLLLELVKSALAKPSAMLSLSIPHSYLAS